MIRCYAVDDEVKAIKLIQALIAEIHSVECTLVGSANSVEAAVKELHELDVDVVFLDIKLGAENGFDLLDHFKNPPFQVVFTTAFNQYAIKAFEYNAIHYILKPIDEEKLAKAIQKVANNSLQNQQKKLLQTLESIKASELQRIAIPSLSRTEILELDDVEHLTGDGSYTNIMVLSKGKITSSRSMAYFEKILPKDRFYRTHKRHIINVNHILEIEKGRSPTIFLRSGTALPVSAANKEGLLKMLETRVHF